MKLDKEINTEFNLHNRRGSLSSLASFIAGNEIDAEVDFSAFKKEPLVSEQVDSTGTRAMLLGHNSLGTPFVITPHLMSSKSTVSEAYLDRPTSAFSTNRHRETGVNMASDFIESDGEKVLFVATGFRGANYDGEGIIELAENAAIPKMRPNPLSGFPVFIEINERLELVGSIYNVGTNNRLYIHHASINTAAKTSLDDDGEETVISRRDISEFVIFFMALEEVANITTNIEDRGMSYESFLEITGSKMMPGSSVTIDSLKNKRATIVSELREAENTLRDLNERVVLASSRILSKRNLHKSMESKEIGMLDLSTIEHPMIESIFSENYGSGDLILVLTKMINFWPDTVDDENPDTEPFDEEEGVACGRFLMVLDLEHGRRPVRFYNRDRVVVAYDGQKMNHPHVFSDGNPCLGSFAGALSLALSDGDIGSAIDVAFLFLRQANSDDSAGKFWPRWLTDENDSCDVLEVI